MRDQAPWELVTAIPPDRIVSGVELQGRLEATANLPRREIRVWPRLSGWPRGDVLIEAGGFTGLAPDDATAVFGFGSDEHGLIAVLPEGGVAVALEDDAPAWQDPRLLELIALTATSSQPAEIGVALLGYGAIGAEHAAAVTATTGLRLVGVADSDPARRTAATSAWPGTRDYDDARALLDDPDVDVVIVSTPPDSHAHWATDALAAGKHVVVEKPMALTARECDDLLAVGAASGLTVSVYQNRRFDPDYRLIKSAVDSGLIGEVFHLEAFVGGYGHPCNFWHSDAAVSGGALFDWGSHIVDQILDLMPGDVDAVSAVNHKRVWHDVTNADHARMTLHFTDGREASFVYSDLAAALKPRWYVLGTNGAITGEWRQESVVARSPIGTRAEDVLAPADSPPRVLVHSPSGDVTAMAPPAHEPHPFHSDLALGLRYGLLPRVRGVQSRRVVAMLQAAEESAALGGQPVKPS
jgi:scyllo-inositol 2-dehydrogenase (NADP+)